MICPFPSKTPKLKVLNCELFEPFAWFVLIRLKAPKTKMLTITINTTTAIAIKTISRFESSFFEAGFTEGNKGTYVPTGANVAV